MRSAHRTEQLTPARLHAVLAVAETGSFSAAAATVGGSQSSVSRAVAAVEATLGTSLFDRSTRSVRLTDAGRDFVERAALVNAELAAAVDAVRPDAAPAPRLVLAALTSVSELHLAPALAELGQPVPRLRCIEALQAGVTQAVVSGRATLGIGDLAQVPAELRVEPLWSEPFRLVVPRDHRLARRRRVVLAEIAGEQLIAFSRDAELRTAVDRELAVVRRLRTPDHIVDRFRTATSMVAAGLGVMVAPAISVTGLPTGTKMIDLDHPGLRRTVGAIRRPEVEPPPVLESVVAGVVEKVALVGGVELSGE